MSDSCVGESDRLAQLLFFSGTNSEMELHSQCPLRFRAYFRPVFTGGDRSVFEPFFVISPFSRRGTASGRDYLSMSAAQNCLGEAPDAVIAIALVRKQVILDPLGKCAGLPTSPHP